MRGEPMTPATDVFSLGVTAMYALTGQWPWKELQDEGRSMQRTLREVHEIILDNNLQRRLPNCLPITVRDALYACLNPEPEDRADIDMLVELPSPNKIAGYFNSIFGTYKVQ
jgi:serine/threonine protein kinase